MNLLFKYRWNHHEPVYGHPPYLVTAIELPEALEKIRWGFNKYLLSSLDTDFPAYRPEWAGKVLAEIEKLERGEIAEYTWSGDGFYHYIKSDSVTFEHSVFNECPEWPLWSCSLAQYKAALLGWKKFIGMPKSMDSELIVELPDDGSSDFPHS